MYLCPMNLDNVFGLFSSGDNSKKEEEKTPNDVILDNFENTPTFKVGMFKKIILNQHVFQKKLINMFKTPKDEFEMDGMEEVGEYIAHHRAWGHIKDCKIDEEIWQGSLTIQHDDYLDTALKLSISFFEEREEYEKCAFLVKIQKYLENSLESKS